MIEVGGEPFKCLSTFLNALGMYILLLLPDEGLVVVDEEKGEDVVVGIDVRGAGGAGKCIGLPVGLAVGNDCKCGKECMFAN